MRAAAAAAAGGGGGGTGGTGGGGTGPAAGTGGTGDGDGGTDAAAAGGAGHLPVSPFRDMENDEDAQFVAAVEEVRLSPVVSRQGYLHFLEENATGWTKLWVVSTSIHSLVSSAPIYSAVCSRLRRSKTAHAFGA